MASLDWKTDTRDAAKRAAAKYYDEVLVEMGMFPGELKRLPQDRDEAIRQLTRENVKTIRDSFPEDSYDKTAKERLDRFDDSKLERWVFEQGDDPYTAAKKEEFAKYSGLVQDGKWLGMSDKQLKMTGKRDFGFDTEDKNEYAAFLNKIAEHDLNYRRGKIVEDEMNSGTGKLAAMFAPSMTKEATRQALTGDFDDDRLNRAEAVDQWSAMAFGLAPGLGQLAPGMGGRAAQFLVNLGIEGGRQAFDYNMGNGFSITAPLGAGVMGATAPAAARYLASRLQRGATNDVKPFFRGFQRGLRGADDPLTEERNALKQSLIDARKVTEREVQAAKDNPMRDEIEVGYNEGQMEAANVYDKAVQKLKTLGYESLEDHPDGVFPEHTPAMPIEAIIGGRPSNSSVTMRAAPGNGAIDEVLANYDLPTTYYGMTNRGPSAAPTQTTVDLNAAARDQMRQVFPEKFSYEVATQSPLGNSKNLYILGLQSGRGASQVARPVQAMTRMEPGEISTGFDDRVHKFRESRWYKELPKEKRNAIEKALKEGK